MGRGRGGGGAGDLNVLYPDVCAEGLKKYPSLLPTGSEERGVLAVRSIPVAILPSCQNMKTMAL